MSILLVDILYINFCRFDQIAQTWIFTVLFISLSDYNVETNEQKQSKFFSDFKLI